MSNPTEDVRRRCPHQSSCPMFDVFQHAGTLAAFQVRYCEAEFATCARYVCSAQGRPVPLLLMPNGAMLKKRV